MNKKQVWVIAFAFIGMLFFISCEKYYHDPKIIRNAVKDYDGNRYDAVKIGNQVWMLTNLRTTHYADGTPIAASISDDPIPGYYRIPGVDEATYGLLYNWYAAVRDTNNLTGKVQGICPKGWHVPSREDCICLLDFSQKYGDGFFQEYGKGPACSLAAQQGWEDYPVWTHYMEETFHQYCPGKFQSNNNDTRFSAVPVGSCCMDWDSSFYDGIDVNYYGEYSLKYNGQGRYCGFWSTGTETGFWVDSDADPAGTGYWLYPDVEFALGISIYYDQPEAGLSHYFKHVGSGLSVRCVKD